MSDTQKQKMNLPNKLTLLRVVMIVPFVLCLLASHQKWQFLGGAADYLEYVALLIFVLASLTDLIDGKIARKYNLVTNFGKFMDPLADKLLVCAAMIVLVEMGRIPSWVVIVIISREFIISGFRLIASDNGIVIAAGYWGKFKTTFQMLMVIVLILDIGTPFFDMLGLILTYVALALTIISLFDYLIRNKDVLKEQK